MTKNPSLGAALLMVLIVTAIFTFGLFSAAQSENKATGAAGLEKVTGMHMTTIGSVEMESYQTGVTITQSIAKDDNNDLYLLTAPNTWSQIKNYDSKTGAITIIDNGNERITSAKPSSANTILTIPLLITAGISTEAAQPSIVVTPTPVEQITSTVWTGKQFKVGSDTTLYRFTGNKITMSDGSVRYEVEYQVSGDRWVTSGYQYSTDNGGQLVFYGADKEQIKLIEETPSLAQAGGIVTPQTTEATTISLYEQTDENGYKWEDVDRDGRYDVVSDGAGNEWIIVYSNSDYVPDGYILSKSSSDSSSQPQKTEEPPSVPPPQTSLQVPEMSSTTTQTTETLVFLTGPAGAIFIYNPDEKIVYDQNRELLSNYKYDPDTETLSWEKTDSQEAGNVKITTINTQITTTEDGKTTSIIYDRNGDATSYSTTENGVTNTVVATYNSKTQATEFLCNGKPCTEDELKNNPNVQTLRDIRHQSYLDFFSHLDFALTKFSGLSGFSSLIWGDDKLNEWRENVDELFASAYLGTEYWTSEICKSSIESVPSNVAMVETAPGVYQAVATISAERSPPVPFENETINITQNAVQYLYKISAYVKAVEDDTKFNIYVSSSSLNKPILNETKTINEGESFSLTGDAIIIKYSFNYYDAVCIVFESGDIPDTCNAIPEASGIVLKGTTGTTTTGGTTTWEEW